MIKKMHVTHLSEILLLLKLSLIFCRHESESEHIWSSTPLSKYSFDQIIFDHINVKRANKVTEVRCCLFTKSMVLSDTNSIPS